MEVFFYQAECGDAARIRFYDNNKKPRNILIDSGYERTFHYILKDEIKQLIRNNERVDLWVISHIHDDHIGGAIKYIKTIQDGELEDVVDKWFYNPPRNYEILKSSKQEEFISSPASISQGDDLFYYIYSKRKTFPYDLTREINPINLGSLRLNILSPTKEKLELLRKKYKSPHSFLESIEDESISDAASFRGHDYFTRIEDFNLDEWREDNSIENGSSIAVLTEFHNKRILLLADSHPTDIVNSLKKMGYTSTNKLVCDLVKVSHHGSAGNNSNELFDLIECSNYLISANGENRHFLPRKETIVRILLNHNRNFEKKYVIYFTYDNPTLRNIFESDGQKGLDKWNFEVKFLKDMKYFKFRL